jgi:hypothetical protein
MMSSMNYYILRMGVRMPNGEIKPSSPGLIVTATDQADADKQGKQRGTSYRRDGQPLTFIRAEAYPAGR